MACREALALAQDLQLRSIVVAYAGKYSMVLDEIKAVSSLFDRVLFKHESRESNYEAHRLARSAFRLRLDVRFGSWSLLPVFVF
jgi:hypothetical protein